MEKSNMIEYRALIAGMLLYFDVVDNVDFSMIVDDFKEKTGMSFSDYWKSLNNISDIVAIGKNDTISLSGGLGLNDRFKNSNKTVKEVLEIVSGDIVLDYFKNFDLEKHYQDKRKKLLLKKNEVLNNFNVLLITDKDEDYDALVEYGFKHIDHFASIINANKYFTNCPEELDKYNIILRGSSSIDIDSKRFIQFDKMVDDMNKDDKIINSYFYSNSNLNYYNIFLSDLKNKKGLCVEESNYEGILDRIVDFCFINDIKVSDVEKKLVPKNKACPIRLASPRKKADLKILFLASYEINNETKKKICDKLGLNVTFCYEDNCVMEKNVEEYLGDYDIIIGSDDNSSYLLGMNREIYEQCNESGRDAVLLAIYDENHMFDGGKEKKVAVKFREMVNNTSLTNKYNSYIWSMNECGDSFTYSLFEAPLYESPSFDNYYKDKIWRMYSNLIEGAVCEYSNKINSILDNDLRSFADITKKYNEENYYGNNCSGLNIMVYNIAEKLSLYLKYVSMGLINDGIDSFKVYEANDSIVLEKWKNDMLEYSAVFGCGVTRDVNKFMLKIPPMEDFEIYGFFPPSFKNEIYNIKKPSCYEWNLINNIYKIVIEKIDPLLEEARIADNRKAKVLTKYHKKY